MRAERNVVKSKHVNKKITLQLCSFARFFGNFRGGYPDFGVQACVCALAPQNPAFFTANPGEPFALSRCGYNALDEGIL